MGQHKRAEAKHYAAVDHRVPSHGPTSPAENLFGYLTWVHSSMALGTWVPSHPGGESSQSQHFCPNQIYGKTGNCI